jgi:hypothetical protein
MGATPAAIAGVPVALHRGEDDLPFVRFDAAAGFRERGRMDLQLLQVDVEAGLWVVRTRFAPGTRAGAFLYIQYVGLLEMNESASAAGTIRGISPDEARVAVPRVPLPF